MRTLNHCEGAMTDTENHPREPERHWNAEQYTDQSILFRIADLLEDIREELRAYRKERQKYYDPRH